MYMTNRLLSCATLYQNTPEFRPGLLLPSRCSKSGPPSWSMATASRAADATTAGCLQGEDQQPSQKADPKTLDGLVAEMVTSWPNRALFSSKCYPLLVTPRLC